MSAAVVQRAPYWYPPLTPVQLIVKPVWVIAELARPVGTLGVEVVWLPFGDQLPVLAPITAWTLQ